jgi:hypothetical protein
LSVFRALSLSPLSPPSLHHPSYAYYFVSRGTNGNVSYYSHSTLLTAAHLSYQLTHLSRLRYPQPSTLNPQFSILYPLPSTSAVYASTHSVNPKPETLNPPNTH